MEEDIFVRSLTLLVPFLFIIGSVLGLIATLRGRSFDDKSGKPRLTGDARRREIIIGCIVSAGMLLFGGWLLYCWLFGPVER